MYGGRQCWNADALRMGGSREHCHPLGCRAAARSGRISLRTGHSGLHLATPRQYLPKRGQAMTPPTGAAALRAYLKRRSVMYVPTGAGQNDNIDDVEISSVQVLGKSTTAVASTKIRLSHASGYRRRTLQQTDHPIYVHEEADCVALLLDSAAPEAHSEIKGERSEACPGPAPSETVERCILGMIPRSGALPRNGSKSWQPSVARHTAARDLHHDDWIDAAHDRAAWQVSARRSRRA